MMSLGSSHLARCLERWRTTSGYVRRFRFFFFSSRRRHTRLQGDWSSDVCSSDLLAFAVVLVASITYLVRRLEAADRLAHASAEVGVLFTGLTIATGSIWGKPTWEIGRASCRERV